MNTENNRIIAEFMDLKPVKVFGNYSISKDHVSVNCENSNDAINSFCKSTKYHSDWNWLMEVVEKIESLGYNFNITSGDATVLYYHCAIYQTSIYRIDGTTKIQATYETVIEFIKWYNLQK